MTGKNNREKLKAKKQLPVSSKSINNKNEKKKTEITRKKRGGGLPITDKICYKISEKENGTCTENKERTIGNGASGKVTICDGNKKKLVVKKPIEKNTFFKNELKYIKDMTGKYPSGVVKMYKMCDSDHNNVSSGIVMEKLTPFKTKKQIAYDLQKAVESLHTIGYYHGDIKPDNIMLNDEGEIKLVDMGNSMNLHELRNIDIKKKFMEDVYIGTYNYCSPKYLKLMFDTINDKIVKKSEIDIVKNLRFWKNKDNWALGCTMYHIITENNIFRSDIIDKTNINLHPELAYDHIIKMTESKLKTILKNINDKKMEEEIFKLMKPHLNENKLSTRIYNKFLNKVT